MPKNRYSKIPKPFSFNSQRKTKIKLSFQALSVLKDDMISFGFGEDSFNEFCNHVFCKFYDKAKSTVTYRIMDIEKSIEDSIRLTFRLKKQQKKVMDALKEAISINNLVDLEEDSNNGQEEKTEEGKKSRKEKIEETKKKYQLDLKKGFIWEQKEKIRNGINKSEEVSLYVNNDSAEIILSLNKNNIREDQNQANNEGDESIKGEYEYHKGVEGYIGEVLEEYAQLSHYDRERYVRKDEIDFFNGYFAKIKKIREEKKLKPDEDIRSIIRVRSNQKTYNFIPYSLVNDPLKTRQYIVGYSYEVGQDISQKRTASFAVARLDKKNISEYKRKMVSLTENDIEELNELILKNRTAYMLGEVKKIKVRLTPEGVIKYRNIITSRPATESRIKDVTPGHEKDMIYTFRCTYRQIENYFLTFCDAAEILEPADLKTIFREHYEKAFKLYNAK